MGLRAGRPSPSAPARRCAPSAARPPLLRTRAVSLGPAAPRPFTRSDRTSLRASVAVGPLPIGGGRGGGAPRGPSPGTRGPCGRPGRPGPGQRPPRRLHCTGPSPSAVCRALRHCPSPPPPPSRPDSRRRHWARALALGHWRCGRGTARRPRRPSVVGAVTGA